MNNSLIQLHQGGKWQPFSRNKWITGLDTAIFRKEVQRFHGSPKNVAKTSKTDQECSSGCGFCNKLELNGIFH